MTGPGDVLILLSLSSRNRIFKPILSFARTSRMKVVVITNHLSLPYYQNQADIIFTCYTASLGSEPSHLVLVSVLKLLASAYVEVAGDAALHRAQIVADIRNELDDQFY